MNAKFEEMFEAKFGHTFSNEGMKFVTKAIMYEGWLLHAELQAKIIEEVDSETKGE